MPADTRFVQKVFMDVPGTACSQAIKLWLSTPVPQETTAESIAAVVLEQEHVLYPQALRLRAKGRLVIEGQRVRVAD